MFHLVHVVVQFVNEPFVFQSLEQFLKPDCVRLLVLYLALTPQQTMQTQVIKQTHAVLNNKKTFNLRKQRQIKIIRVQELKM